MKWESVYLYGVLGAFALVSFGIVMETDEEIIRITSTAFEMRISCLAFVAELMLALVCVYRLSRSK